MYHKQGNQSENIYKDYGNGNGKIKWENGLDPILVAKEAKKMYNHRGEYKNGQSY